MSLRKDEKNSSYLLFIIEDDIGLNRLISKRLQKEGYKVFSAFDGKLAQDELKKIEPDLLLLDYQLPDMNGNQFIELIHDNGKTLPFIVMTGHADVGLAVNMMKKGALDYIVKDNNLLELLPQKIYHAFDNIYKDKQLLYSQNALKESERRLSILMKNLPGMAYRSLNQKGWPMLFVSYGCLELTGYSPDELTSKNKLKYGDIIHPDDREFVWDEVQKAVKIKKPFEIEYRIISKKDKTKWAWERGQLVEENENGRILEGFISDITKIKEIEKEKSKLYQDLKKTYKKLENQTTLLAQTEKMSAIGTMAAGVAHELNNPMMGILNYAQYCKKNTKESDKRYSILEDIETETIRCSGIVKNLLTFSHGHKQDNTELKAVKCEDIINRIIRLLSYRIEKNNVDVQFNTLQNTPEVIVQENKLQEVFLNIFTNALDAIETRKHKQIQISLEPNRQFLKITVEDSGIGIKKEHLKKIYDPFFTTKPPGKGTGLGMSIIKNILKDNKGYIKINSKVNHGTKIQVGLPIENQNWRDQ